MQAIDGIGIGLVLFRLEGDKLRAVHLIEFAKEGSFLLIRRLEHFHPCNTVVSIYSLCHVGFQWSCLSVEVDDTFLDIGVLFSQFLMYLCLCYLGIE